MRMLAASLLIVLFATTGRAAFVTYNIGFINQGSQPTDLLLVPKFDIAGTTLRHVRLDFTATSGTLYSISAPQAVTPVDSTLIIERIYLISFPGGSGAITGETTMTDFTLAPGASRLIGVNSSASFSIDLPPTDLLVGTGFGDGSVSYVPRHSTIDRGSTDYNIGENNNAFTFSGTITYTYTPAVPEPASLALAAAGIGTLGVWFRWRQATRPEGDTR
jgi:hypothetical protein